MTYLLAFGRREEEMATLANRLTDWFVRALLRHGPGEELRRFVEVTICINGFSILDDHGDENHLRDAYARLLRDHMPDVVEQARQEGLSPSFIQILEDIGSLAVSHVPNASDS